ncbi:SWIM zinc finger family protein [Actinosynnema sp. NPDC051121]
MVAVEVSAGTVRRLADPRSFERGEEYFADGRVRRISVDGTTVSATVDGTHAYRVRLDVTRSGLRGRCSCPHDVEFCKHCVAVALAWLSRAGEATARPHRKPLSDKRLRSFLLDRDPEWLVDRLMTAAKADEVLRARLDLAAGVDPDRAFDGRGLRERLEFAIDVPDYVDLAAAHQYFHHVERALDEVARMVDNGLATAAIGLAEYAVQLLEDATDRVEDIGGVEDAIARAEQIHLAARAAQGR